MIGCVVDCVNLSRCLISYVSCDKYDLAVCFVEFVRYMVLGAEQVVLWCPTLPQRLHLCRRGGAPSRVPAERILLFLGRPACLTLTAGFMAPSGISCDLSGSLIPCALDRVSEKHDELYRVLYAWFRKSVKSPMCPAW